MQLGFVSAILPELGLDEVLQFASAEGFRCVELMCWPKGKAERKFAGVTHVDVGTLTKTAAEDILAQTLKHKVRISGLGYYPNPLDPSPEVSSKAIQHIRKVIRAARLLNLDRVNTFVGRDWTRSVDDNWPRFLRVWRPLVAFAEDHGVTIGIENCPMLFTQDEWPGGKNLATTPVIWRRMFSDIPSRNFGLNYDPSHLVLQHMDPALPLKEFASRIVHFHAKDVKIHVDRRNEVGVFAPPLQWHQPRIPGFGEIDWGRFLATLMETSYRGPVCIEVEDDTFGKTLDGRTSALKAARNVLQPFLPS
ncbi:MAG: sugar phosphate isomerase/epimerase [Verrucomicrobia bacterium]|nr:sugar phosphate isomerase/epimerase [Verrucomicrobiota bacterium]